MKLFCDLNERATGIFFEHLNDVFVQIVHYTTPLLSDFVVLFPISETNVFNASENNSQTTKTEKYSFCNVTKSTVNLMRIIRPGNSLIDRHGQSIFGNVRSYRHFYFELPALALSQDLSAHFFRYSFKYKIATVVFRKDREMKSMIQEQRIPSNT